MVVYRVAVLLCVRPLGLYRSQVMAGTPIWALGRGALAGVFGAPRLSVLTLNLAPDDLAVDPLSR